jgi:predicted ArsR family transcriptional regulator
MADILKRAGLEPAPTEKMVQLDIFDELTMDSESQQVLGLIRVRHGRQQAITVDSIAESAGIPSRTVRDIVKHLIENHHIMIGSSLGRPAGYFMIATKEEAEQNERTLRKLGISILVHAAVLKRLSVKEYIRRLQEEIEF